MAPVTMAVGGNPRHERWQQPRVQADFYAPNGKPKCLWLRELRPGARKLAITSMLSPEHADAVIDVTSGKMSLFPHAAVQLDGGTARSTRASNTYFCINPVLCIEAMALLCGARQIREIAHFANRLRPAQRRELGLPRKKATRAFYEVPGYSVFHQLLTHMELVPFGKILSQRLTAQ